MTHAMRRILALLLAALLLAGGCLAESAPEGVLGVVNGQTVPLTDAQIEFDYYAGMYESYGLADEIETLRGQIADYYVQYYVLLDAARQMGLDDFSQEELDGFAEQAQTQYDAMLADYRDYFAQDDMTEEQITAETAAFLAENRYTPELIESSIRESALVQRFYDRATADVTVTDEAVRGIYDEQVAAQQAGYDADPASFEFDVMYGNEIYYVPEGFRSVYHILLLLDDAAQDTLFDLQARQEEIAAELTADGADTQALNAENAEIEAQIDELCADLMERAMEIRGRLDAGEDFMALMEEYGEDPGMQSEPYLSKGYYVSANSDMWEPNFRDAAMALENVGDVSEPVLTGYGIHLILYSAELVPGAVPFETVRESLADEALSTLQEQAIDEAIQAAMDAAQIEVYPENLIYEPAADGEEAVG